MQRLTVTTFVENLPPDYQKVLRKQLDNTPIISDIRTVKGEDYETDGVTIVSGEYEANHSRSQAKEKKQDDDRYLWDQDLELSPKSNQRWFIVKVNGLINIQDGMV